MNIFNLINKQIENLKKNVPFFNIGKTPLNRNIVCFVLGDAQNNNKILLQGGIHAREYITSFLLIKIINVLKNFSFDACVYVVPFVNSDGVYILSGGLKNIKNTRVLNIYSKFETNLNLIKCNAFGVDLNTNFNALWGNGGKNLKNKPNSENFIGYKEDSEREVKALESLTLFIKPKITISYHSKGEVFYWGFDNSKKYSKQYIKLEKKCVVIIKKTTGYKPIFTKSSCGGYKDWCIKQLKIPSFTIEVGSDSLKHPISINNLKTIFDKNKNLVFNLLKGVF